MGDEFKIPMKYLVIAFAIVVVIGLFFVAWKTTGLSIFSGGGGVSEDEAAQKMLNFFSEQVPESVVEIVSASKQENFYRFDLNLDGEAFPVYVTLDGKYMTIDVIPLGD